MKNLFTLLFFVYFISISPPTYAQSSQELLIKGATALQAGDTAQAVSFFEQMLTPEEKALGVNELLRINTVISLAGIYKQQGKFSKTDSLLSKSIKEIQEKQGKKNIFYTMLIGQQAMLYDAQAMYLKAQELHIEALHLLREIEGDRSMMYAIALSNLAKSYYEEGKYKYAEPLWLDVLVILKPISKNPLFAIAYITALTNVANLYHEVGDYAQSATLFGEAKTLYNEILATQVPDYAHLLNDYASLYQDMGDYPKAELLLIESMAINANNKQSIGYYTSLNNLATLYQTLGNTTKAEPLLKEALALIEANFGKNRDYATACNNLAELYRSSHLYDKAIPLYQASKDIYAKEKNTKYIVILNNLGELKKQIGELQEAEKYFIEAKEKSEQLLGKQHIYSLIATNNLALLYLEIGKPTLAEAQLLQNQSDAPKYSGYEHQLYLSSLTNLALAYYAQAQYAKAAPLFIQSAESMLQVHKTNYVSLSEKEKRKYWNVCYPFIYNFFGFLTEVVQHKPDLEYLPVLLQTALDLRLSSKGMFLEETQKMKYKIWQSKDANLVNQFHAWQALKNKIAKMYHANVLTDLPKLEQQADDLEKQLALRSATLQSFFSFAKVSYLSVQQVLNEQDAAVEIIKTILRNPKTKQIEYAYLALILSQKRMKVILIPNAKDLETNHLSTYRRLINTQKTFDSLSFEVFWGEINRQLTIDVPRLFLEEGKLYFSPDGAYHQINPNTLYNPQTKKYILEEYNIRRITNLKEILEKHEPNPQMTASLFGKPIYGANEEEKNTKSSKNETSEGLDTKLLSPAFKTKWSVLLGTEKEIRELDALLKSNHWQTKIYIALQATEEQLKSVQSPKVLHIATHGYFAPTGNIDLGMFNSGIVLTGVNLPNKSVTQEDGALNALEASTLQLDDTDLVVLSACETGLGEVSTGEGVYGLQRGFKAAGAKSILMSLWKASDFSSPKLMNFFYKYWLSGMDKHDAFRKAQKEIKANQNYKSPFFWGVFTLVGE